MHGCPYTTEIFRFCKRNQQRNFIIHYENVFEPKADHSFIYDEFPPPSVGSVFHEREIISFSGQTLITR